MLSSYTPTLTWTFVSFPPFPSLNHQSLWDVTLLQTCQQCYSSVLSSTNPAGNQQIPVTQAQYRLGKITEMWGAGCREPVARVQREQFKNGFLYQQSRLLIIWTLQEFHHTHYTRQTFLKLLSSNGIPLDSNQIDFSQYKLSFKSILKCIFSYSAGIQTGQGISTHHSAMPCLYTQAQTQAIYPLPCILSLLWLLLPSQLAEQCHTAATGSNEAVRSSERDCKNQSPEGFDPEHHCEGILSPILTPAPTSWEALLC